MEKSADRKVDRGASYLLSSLTRGLAVLSLFSEAKATITLSDAENRLGLGRSRTYKILETLTNAEYLTKSAGRTGYQLGPASLLLGLAALRQNATTLLATETLKHLTRETGETSGLTMRVGHRSMIVAAFETEQQVRSMLPVGRLCDLHAGGSHVPLLAFAPCSLRRQFLEGAVPMSKYTSHTSSTPESLEELIQRVREQGFHASDGEVEEGVTAIGVPIFIDGPEASWCISVSGPSVRVQPRLNEMISAVRSAAQRLTDHIVRERRYDTA